ncbi:hypothetical protein B0J15DRAFT_487552 [Fusarium solani]|uniref:Uncharacterized protein n=1 Tax=Fusarium solani TaxID=169388 RepID=A0A9P9KK64_FUSSL|nr:uncharacterized protein B0J15DRAFT_487552 [Fusarium solani]KAH7265977.1 hypothetical protein B0J15DRAFT_487552 [Fusarium solani]
MAVPKTPRPVLQLPFRAPCEYDPEAAQGTPSLPPSPPCSQTNDVGTSSSSEHRGSQSSSEENLPAESRHQQNEGRRGRPRIIGQTAERPQPRGPHQVQTERLQKILQPILGLENDDSCVLLLCCGSFLACRILVVKIPISTIIDNDYVAIWNLIQESWNALPKSWRHRLPFYGVKQVSLASEVSLLAKIESRGAKRPGDNESVEFIGACTPEDLRGEVQRQRVVIGQELPLVDYPCLYDRQRQVFQHDEICADAHQDVGRSYQCPFEEVREAKRKLWQLSRRSFLTLAFQRPELSEANNLLPTDLFYSHLAVLRLCDLWECPSLYELSFQGLIIEEGWLLSSPSPFLAAIGIMLMSTTLFKFIFGGWDAAWGAASCLVTVAMFGYQYTKDQPGHKAACL